MKKILILSVACLTMALSAGAQRGPIREKTEWMDAVVPHATDRDLPHVLLVGNSITRAYYPEVAELLRGDAYVSLLATSKSLGDPALLRQVAEALREADYDVVHFNNGLHGWGYSERQYAKDFPALLRVLRKGAPKARLVWATTTPVRCGERMEEFAPETPRIRERNRIAARCIDGRDIAVDDLYGLMENRPEYYEGGDGIHPLEPGVKALAAQVAAAVSGNPSLP